MIKQDTLERQVKSTYLSIGSNLGDKRANIEKAKYFLSKNGILIQNISSCYETPSWPNKSFPNFFNIIVKIKTKLSLVDLFKTIKKIERDIGRKKTLRNYPRVCDIDIIAFKGKCLNVQLDNNKIQTPHPRMYNRNFVIFPLYEVNKSWIHPKTKANIYTIIKKFRNVDFSAIRIV